MGDSPPVLTHTAEPGSLLHARPVAASREEAEPGDAGQSHLHSLMASPPHHHAKPAHARHTGGEKSSGDFAQRRAPDP